MRIHYWILIPALVLGLGLDFGLAGCSDDEGGPHEPCCEEYPAATTPDQAMENFERAWEEMNLEEYSKLLHEDFLFAYDYRIILGLKVRLPQWTREIELDTVGAMFTKQPGFDPIDHDPLPPVIDINFAEFLALDDEWQPGAPGSMFEGTFRRGYQLDARVTYDGVELAATVLGQQVFYVYPDSSGEETLWQIKFWEDRGSPTKLGSENISWTELKSYWADMVYPDAVTLSQPGDEDITSDTVHLQWTESTDPAFDHYKVVLWSPGSSSAQAIANIFDVHLTTHLVDQLLSGSQYSFRVDVVDTDGWVGPGNTITVTTDGPGEFVPATTPDLAMSNFVAAWENLHLTEYSKLLHEQFQFFFDPADNLGPVLGGETWGRPSELAAIEAMFTAQPGFDPSIQEPIPPIESIRFDVFVALDPGWQIPPDEPRYAGTIRQRYQVSLTMTFQGSGELVRVAGVNYFYLTNAGDASNPLWQIKVWEDQASTDPGNKSPTRVPSWGLMKATWSGN